MENQMLSNPIYVDVDKHLEGVDYPARGEELASAARSNDAPDALVESLRDLGDQELSGLGEVKAALVRQVIRRQWARLRLLRPPE
jgi:hypothetical protein